MAAEGFGERLKALRESAGLNQKQLAEVLGVDQASVSRWERGLGEPGLSMAGALAAALGVAVEELVKPPAKAPARKPKRGGRERKGE